MASWIKRIDDYFYPNFRNNWDDTLFREMVLESITPDHVILDLGAGAGIVSQMNFRGIVSKVCGVDPDPRIIRNPFLDEGVIGTGESIPYPDNHFDLVIANNVLEHIFEPVPFLREIYRVLKRGGIFLAKTPNRYHYVAILSKITPHSIHELVARLRRRASADTFPTWYRLNDRRAIRNFASKQGFSCTEIRLMEGRPEYLRIHPLLYVIGLIYERIVNSTRFLEFLRVILVCRLQKI